MVQLVLSLGGGWRTTTDSDEALQQFAEMLRDPDTEVRIEIPEPGGYGVIWGEVVIIYLAMKTLDLLTDKALDALYERIADRAKEWTTKRVEDRVKAGKKRIMATTVRVAQEDGPEMGSIRAEADAAGTVTTTVSEPKHPRDRPAAP